MTTGSWDNSVIHFHELKRTSLKTWSGGDRPKTPKGPRHDFVVVRDGKTYHHWFRENVAPRRVKSAPHDYSMHAVSMFAIWNAHTADGVNTGFGYMDNWCQNHFPSTGLDCSISTIDANDQLKAVAKLREKIFGSNFNAAVALAEGNQTLRLIADSATRITRALGHVRTGNMLAAWRDLVAGTSRDTRNKKFFRKREPPTNDVSFSNLWIELQYGWRPLLEDVEGAAQSLAHRLHAPLQQSYVSSVRKEKVEIVQNLVGFPNPYQHRLKNVSRVRVQVLVKEQPSVVDQLQLLNVASVAWEKTPWSFVIDWFIPVGQYLDARAVGSIVSGTYITTMTSLGVADQVIDTATLPRPGPDWFAAFYYDPSSYLRTEYTLSRVVGTAPNLPLPAFKGLGKAASWQHCANALALLGQKGDQIRKSFR